MQAFLLSWCLGLMASPAAFGDDFDREPIEYSKTPADDPIARLLKRLEQGEAKLEHDARFGYLPSMLRELGVSSTSQVLVFSKTSFQRELISPRAPRALYFGDDVYVGYVQGGEVLELAGVDPRQGTMFYTLDQSAAEKPRPLRHNAECLQCHASPLTKGVPGLLVRSVYPDRQGLPILKAGTFVTDHTSPLKERWGGWYVTGTHGFDRHMGNSFLQSGDANPDLIRSAESSNVTSLNGFFSTEPYLSPHSDIIALMLLEHQSQLHNLVTAANYQARVALYQQEAMSSLTGDPPGRTTESTLRRFEYAAQPLLKYILFADEMRLTAPIKGTSAFAVEQAKLGPRDRKGRSLRELDLTTRLFKYPCSYLIYTEPFRKLPVAFKDYFFSRLREILTADQAPKEFSYLSGADRKAIYEILVDTLEDLPAAWKQEPSPGKAVKL